VTGLGPRKPLGRSAIPLECPAHATEPRANVKGPPEGADKGFQLFSTLLAWMLSANPVAEADAQRTSATLDTSSFFFAECTTNRTLLPFFNFEVRTLSDSFLAFTDLFFKTVVLVAL
jgi:hypothetical protein